MKDSKRTTGQRIRACHAAALAREDQERSLLRDFLKSDPRLAGSILDLLHLPPARIRELLEHSPDDLTRLVVRLARLALGDLCSGGPP